MNKPPRLVVTDLDGTLLRSDGSVSARTVDTIRRVQDAGIEFVVATARPPRWMHGLVDVVGTHGLAICANGAFVYDVAGRRIVAERTLTRGDAVALTTDLRAVFPTISFASESRSGFAKEPRYETDENVDGDEVRVGMIEDLLDPPPAKLLARDPQRPPGTFVQAVASVVGDRAIVAFSGARGLAEISARGVTKAAALARWCAERDIAASDVWAFGDMPNDLAMLSWAGTSFAVANAHPDVVSCATHRCGANDADGVAAVLEQAMGISD